MLGLCEDSLGQEGGGGVEGGGTFFCGGFGEGAVRVSQGVSAFALAGGGFTVEGRVGGGGFLATVLLEGEGRSFCEGPGVCWR